MNTHLLAFVVLLPLLAGTPYAHAESLSPQAAAAIVNAPDRTEADRERDPRRKPAELLVFAEVGPGMKVADIGASSGYTTELLARSVGSEGVVYGQNTPFVLEKYVKESWPERLARPVNANVVRVDSELVEPLPDDAKGLDVITMVFVYHDTLFSGVDRAAMNAALFAALRPGGSLVVVDHQAAPGGESAKEVAETLHRMDEALLRQELAAAGFKFAGEAEFLRNPDDPRDAPFFKMDGPTDAFVHRYTRP